MENFQFQQYLFQIQLMLMPVKLNESDNLSNIFSHENHFYPMLHCHLMTQFVQFVMQIQFRQHSNHVAINHVLVALLNI